MTSQPCPAGYYCPSSSDPASPQQPVECPAGYYYKCPAGSCTSSKCQCGHYCPSKSSDETESQPAYRSPFDGATTPTPCPRGCQCPSWAMCAPMPCPPGTMPNSAVNSGCNPYPEGSYCPTANQSLPCPAAPLAYRRQSRVLQANFAGLVRRWMQAADQLSERPFLPAGVLSARGVQ